VSFQSDPDFPSSIKYHRYRSAQIELFQSLFQDYSKFSITKETDRTVAIDSLATALAGREALDTKVCYGIFERYLHRSLLWQPAQNIPLRQISYPDGKAPPSWSWMAYHWQIQYLRSVKFGDVEWDKSVRIVNIKASDEARKPENDGYVLEARVRRLQGCNITPESAGHVVWDEKDNEVGRLWFDTEP